MEENILIERLSYGSAGVGHVSSGKTIFVDKSVPGDVVKVKTIEDRPRFSRALITEIVEASSSRVFPPCPYYESCGGCPWQHIDYPMQLNAKRENIVSTLTRNGKIDPSRAQTLVAPVLGSKREFGYRNKLEFACSYSATKGFALGFLKPGSHDIVNVDFCPLAHRSIEKSAKALRGALRYLQSTQDLGIFRVGIRNSLRTGDTEIALWTKPGPFPRATVAKTLKTAVKTTSIVRIIADPGKARAVKKVEMLDGKGYWEEELADMRFKTSAPSFFQVNTAQAEKLIREVLDKLSLDRDSLVADLYAGGGSFSLALAQICDDVLAIESASSSVKDLRRNAEANHLDIDIIGGDTARELPLLGTLDALVVDPPRAGLADGVIESIVDTKATQIAYVSCDPATWARDVARFERQGYHLTSVQPVDLFPQSYHVEVVSIFERKSDVRTC